MVTSFCVNFSGITVRFRLPEKLPVPPAFQSLLCEDPGQVDDEYEIYLLTSPLVLEEEPFCAQAGIFIYKREHGYLRVYNYIDAPGGCQTACLMRENGHHVFYYPASRWKEFSRNLNILHLICGEQLLMRHDAFLLHSSLVMLNGKTVLFSGPSGAGKSTQARLWERHLGAEILNGDRCAVQRRENGFYGGGSLWCGTSGIRRPEAAPIAGIFLLNQALENRVERLGFSALSPLLSQTTVNSWDPGFMEKLMALYGGLLEAVPVFRLDCRADEEAVKTAYQVLF